MSFQTRMTSIQTWTLLFRRSCWVASTILVVLHRQKNTLTTRFSVPALDAKTDGYPRPTRLQLLTYKCMPSSPEADRKQIVALPVHCRFELRYYRYVPYSDRDDSEAYALSIWALPTLSLLPIHLMDPCRRSRLFGISSLVKFVHDPESLFILAFVFILSLHLFIRLSRQLRSFIIYARRRRRNDPTLYGFPLGLLATLLRTCAQPIAKEFQISSTDPRIT
jgi:hypothetical protein